MLALLGSIFNVLEALVDATPVIEILRILMINDSRNNLGELPPIERGGFPISQNVSVLERDEFVDQLLD